MTSYAEKTFTTRDGLRIVYRDYVTHAAGKLPILLLTGAPDNVRVYHELALHLAKTRRVLTLDWRGHGKSDKDPDYNHYGYVEDTQDVIELLATEKVSKVVVLGTSMGGTVVLHLGAKRLDLVAGAIINDIGPVLGEKGKARLLKNNEMSMEWDTYEEAAESFKLRMGVGVKRTRGEWLAYTLLLTKELPNGKIIPDTDPDFRISTRTRPRPPDYWALFEAMKSVPFLMIRGEGSDLLERSTIEEMKRRKPDLESVEVPDRGHNPFLDEPAAMKALDSFLARAP